MPNLTVTLTDAQWAAYQAVSSNPSLDDISAWLKIQLTADYQRRLEGIDSGAVEDLLETAEAARNTKIEAF